MKFIDSIVRFDMCVRVTKACVTVELIEIKKTGTWLLTSKEKDKLIKAIRVLNIALDLIDETNLCDGLSRYELMEQGRHAMQLLKQHEEAMENIMDIVED